MPDVLFANSDGLICADATTGIIDTCGCSEDCEPYPQESDYGSCCGPSVTCVSSTDIRDAANNFFFAQLFMRSLHVRFFNAGLPQNTVYVCGTRAADYGLPTTTAASFPLIWQQSAGPTAPQGPANCTRTSFRGRDDGPGTGLRFIYNATVNRSDDSLVSFSLFEPEVMMFWNRTQYGNSQWVDPSPLTNGPLSFLSLFNQSMGFYCRGGSIVPYGHFFLSAALGVSLVRYDTVTNSSGINTCQSKGTFSGSWKERRTDVNPNQIRVEVECEFDFCIRNVWECV